MLKTKINDVIIKPIPLPKFENKDIRGADMFDNIYSNVFLCAKKKSGKTNVIYNIIKKCVDKNSTVIVFCSTHLKDAAWIEIKKYLDKKDIPNKFYSSLVEDGIDQLAALVNQLQNEVSESEESEESEPEAEIIRMETNKIEIKINKRKSKKISQKYMIILDDLSLELKNSNVAHLLKTNRHYRSKVLISSQYINDLLPTSRRQIDVYILFSGLNEQKLREIFINADLNIEFSQFMDLYKDATDKRYSFFYVDASNCEYRQNFNQKYII